MAIRKNAETLYYKKDEDYVAHFTSLMQEAVCIVTEGYDSVAMEFSGGIDSSAIYCAADSLDINPEGFLHEPLLDSPVAQYDDRTEKAMLKQYPMFKVNRINADNFDPISVFKQYANDFAGPAPHIFYMLSQNIHQAVAERGHKVLLSGFGGDQCVSAHLPPRFVLPDLLKQGKYLEAWDFLRPHRKKRDCIRNLLSLSHPGLYSFDVFLKNIRRRYCNETLLQSEVYTRYFSHLRDAEYDFLQGDLSHEIRMRVESGLAH